MSVEGREGRSHLPCGEGPWIFSRWCNGWEGEGGERGGVRPSQNKDWASGTALVGWSDGRGRNGMAPDEGDREGALRGRDG